MPDVPHCITLEQRLDGFQAAVPSQPLDALRLLGAMGIFMTTLATVPLLLWGLAVAAVLLGRGLLVTLGVPPTAAELACLLLVLPVSVIVLVAGVSLSSRLSVRLIGALAAQLMRLRATLSLSGRVLVISSWRRTHTVPLADGLAATVARGQLCLADRTGWTLRLWTGTVAARWLAAQLNAACAALALGSAAEIPAAVAALRERAP